MSNSCRWLCAVTFDSFYPVELRCIVILSGYEAIISTYTQHIMSRTSLIVNIRDATWESSLFQVNMQLHIEYARITNQIFHSFLSTIQLFNHECQMPLAHSVFKQTVLNVSAHQLQQHTIEICCKMIQLWTREAKHSVSSTKRPSSWHYTLTGFGMCLWYCSSIVAYLIVTHVNPLAHPMVHCLLFYIRIAV